MSLCYLVTKPNQGVGLDFFIVKTTKIYLKMSFIFKQIRKKVKYTKLVGQRSLENVLKT